MLITNYIIDKKNPTLLVVPFRNESFRLHKLITQLNVLKLTNSVDVVLVDGGSTDDSKNSDLFQKCGIHTLIELKNSKGLGEQLRQGFSWAIDRGYRNVITIDSNGKDDPAHIPQIIDHLENGYDFVQASRYMTGGAGINTPLLRHIGIKYIHVPALRLASGFRWTDTTQGYRGYSIQILQDRRVSIFRDIFTRYELLFYLSYRLPRLGYRCIEVPVVRTYPNGPVPTKIRGWSMYMYLLSALFKSCIGFYNPTER